MFVPARESLAISARVGAAGEVATQVANQLRRRRITLRFGQMVECLQEEIQSRFLGRGCDEELFSEKKGFSVKRGEAIQ